MKKLHFESLQELDAMFKDSCVEMTNTIRDSIQQAYDNKKRVANLFEIQMDGIDSVLEISLSKKEWTTALDNCLKQYTEWGMSDSAIDTYLLIQNLKNG
jgi:hypothetical protein